MRQGDTPTDEFGDQLLEEVRSRYTDSRLIVFTGFATVRHVQDSLQGGGQLPSWTNDPRDKVSVLEKDQSIEFRNVVREFRALLQGLEDVEIISTAEALGKRGARAMRRLACEYGAASIRVDVLAGGLTGAPVWKCELSSVHGVIAVVVAKQVATIPHRGGLPELLPVAMVTAPVATISGLMGGAHLSVLQLAGEGATPLFSVLGEDPIQAARYLATLHDAMGTISEETRLLTLDEIVSPYITWSDLERRLAEHHVSVPSPTLRATVRTGMRHGDLHLANVLIVERRPVLIDFDSSVFGASSLDSVATMLSTLVHPDSPIRGSLWPSIADIHSNFGGQDFGAGHSHAVWFSQASRCCNVRRSSEREFWAVVLAFAARQLKYSDVTDDPETVGRVVAIAGVASHAIASA